MGYTFISYSSKNRASADAMRDLLISSGVDTWMAPGDIPAGSKYAQVINRAIKECACMLLMLSRDALNSVWVAKEVERAVNYRKPIISVQIEDVILNDEFELYISTDQVVAVQKIERESDDIQKVLRSVIAYTGVKKRGSAVASPVSDAASLRVSIPSRDESRESEPQAGPSVVGGSNRKAQTIANDDMPKQTKLYARSHSNNTAGLAQIRRSIIHQGIELAGLSNDDFISSTTAIALTNVNSSVRFCVLSSGNEEFEYKQGKKIPTYKIDIDSVSDIRMMDNQLILKQNKKWIMISLDGKILSSTRASLFGPEAIKIRTINFAYTNRYVDLWSDGTLTAFPVQGKEVTLSRRGENKKYIDFAMCTEHFIALLDDGTVQSRFFQDNQDYGQCDVDDWRDIKKVCVCQYFSVGLKKDGTVISSGRKRKEFNELDSWSNVTDIASSPVYIIGLTEDGKVLGTHGLTKALSSWTNIVKIAISENHVVAGLRSDGNVLVRLSCYGSTFQIPLGTDISFT